MAGCSWEASTFKPVKDYGLRRFSPSLMTDFELNWFPQKLRNVHGGENRVIKAFKEEYGLNRKNFEKEVTLRFPQFPHIGGRCDGFLIHKKCRTLVEFKGIKSSEWGKSAMHLGHDFLKACKDVQ